MVNSTIGRKVRETEKCCCLGLLKAALRESRTGKYCHLDSRLVQKSEMVLYLVVGKVTMMESHWLPQMGQSKAEKMAVLMVSN